MRSHELTALAALALAMTALPDTATAQARQRRARAEIRFAEMDRNGDRVITRAEWRGSEQSFRVHDWDGDGILSGDEVRVGAARATTEEDFDPSGRPQFRNWTEEGFANLDRNRDGRISRAEWYYDREAFVRADRNGDNWLTRAEFIGDGADEDREDRFEYLDANNNGRIERSEWHGSAETFEWMDRNNDGTLSRAEAGSGAGGREEDLFASLDANKDNVITSDEWQWSRQSFVRQDRNRDGELSRSELSNAELRASGAGDTSLNHRTVELDAARGWMNTGFDVRQGDTITFEAKGRVQLSANAADTADPAGAERRVQSAPVPNANAGALVARIGDSPPIVIGRQQRITANQSGRLFLTVNDDHFADNLGTFIVVILRQ